MLLSSMSLPVTSSPRLQAAQAFTIFLLLTSALLSIGLSLGRVLPPSWLALWLVAGGCAAMYAFRSPRSVDGPGPDWLSLLPILCATALVTWTYSGPNVLPVNDPIAIPALATHLVAGELPASVYPPGSFGHAYPSGAPLLFSALWGAMSPAQGLMVLKLLTLLALVLIPASWGWLLHRSFALPLRLPLWLTLCYLAFWGLERTIGFVLPFAGKTALIWALALCPLLTAFLWDSAHRASPWRWLAGGLALFGLIMLNYSMAHLTAACLAGLWLARLERGRAGQAVAALRLFAMLTLAALLVLLLMRDAISDPRAGGFQFAPWLRMHHMVELFLQEKTPVVIFHNTEQGMVQPLYRGAIQLAAWALAWLAAPHVAQGRYVRSLRACLLIILLILLAGFGVVPSGITLDYARWIVWPVQALSFALVMAMAWSAAREWRGLPRALAAVLATLLIGASLFMIRLDGPALKQVVRADAVPIKRLVQEAGWLQEMAGPGPCRLIGDSHVTGDNLSVYQVSRLYGHVPLVSSCRFVNGSWVDKDVAEARAWDGLPSADQLRTLLNAPGATLLLIGSVERMQPYMSRLAGEGMPLAWETLHLPSGAPVWRARVPR